MPLLSKLRLLLLCTLLSSPLLSGSGLVRAQSLPSLGDTEREGLSPLTERKLGEEIMRDLRRDNDYLDDAPLLEYLNDFGNKLVAARPDVRGENNYNFFFFAVRDPVLNAFALPGGFIAVHSGLIIAAQSESELASVLAHEIGHVAQRHIARMISMGKDNTLIQLAAMVLGALALRSNGDAGMGVMMGGSGIAIQRQLNFSRAAEREADRVGLQILTAGDFDTSGMVMFFSRLQTASRSAGTTLPPYLLTHPLTTERIADIQARIQDQRYRQHRDSADFQLIRARVRILQSKSGQDLREAQTYFENLLLQDSKATNAAALYGMALVALRQERYGAARDLLARARAAASPALLAADAATGVATGVAVPETVASMAATSAAASSAATTPAASGKSSLLAAPTRLSTMVLPTITVVAATPAPGTSVLFAGLEIEIELAAGHAASALKLAEAARLQFPVSRAIARQEATALIGTHKYDTAITYLREQARLYRDDAEVQNLLAQAYSGAGQKALQHMALAESYALNGSLPAAIDQLAIARQAPDATFYDLSLVDAREREWKAQFKEEMDATKF